MPHLERVAVVGVAVDPHDVGFGVHAVDRGGQLVGLVEEARDLVDAVDEHPRPHLRELALHRVHELQREAGERRHRTRDVGDHHDLRLRRARPLELRLGRHAAVRQRVAHGLAEVERAAVPVPAALREPRRERARQRVDRLLELLHLLARRVHEVDVFGQRLAQRARHRLDAAVGHEPPPDLGLDHLLQDLEAAFVLLVREALVERALADLLVLLRPAPSSCRRGPRRRAAAACGRGSRRRRPDGPAPCPRTARPPRRASARELLACPCASARRAASARALRWRAGPSRRRASISARSWSKSACASAPSSPPSPPSTPGLKIEKYTSNTVSNTLWWPWCFTSVAPSAVLNASRSSSGTYSTARIASRFSVIDTGQPGEPQLVHEALQHVEHRRLARSPRSRRHPLGPRRASASRSRACSTALARRASRLQRAPRAWPARRRRAPCAPW